jgi:hypothetical protein
MNEWAMFLATYLPRMKFIHESGEAHLNADDLSRLACVEDDDDKKQYQESESIISLSTKTDDTQTNFLNIVKEELSKDDIFEKIMNKIKKQIVQADFNNEELNMTYHSYKLNPDCILLYLTERLEPDRLCNPKKCRKRSTDILP